MKALSLLQPWAWLVVHGHKDIENRTWALPRTLVVPQRVYIHAGKSERALRDPFKTINFDWINERLPPDGTMDALWALPWPRGALVGEATITGCVTESDSRWFEGPYGFTLTDATAYAEPVPWKGALGFFTVDNLVGGP